MRREGPARKEPHTPASPAPARTTPGRDRIHAGLLDLQARAGNAAVAQILAAGSKSPIVLQRAVQTLAAWFVLNPPVSAAGAKTYLTNVVLPLVDEVCSFDPRLYQYVRDQYSSAEATLDEAIHARDVALYGAFRKKLPGLLTALEGAIDSVGLERDRLAAEDRRAALRGDGGYPIGMVRGSGQTAAAVIRNDVRPEPVEATSKRYVVWIEHHQNKHQITMIPGIGQWGAKMGTRFAPTEGLAWHTTNTAAWARDHVIQNLANVPPGGAIYSPDKTKTVDANDITYDLKAWLDAGVVNVSYHCNPKSQRS